MNISTETIGRLLASARGYSQWVAGFCTSLALSSAASSKAFSDSLVEIASGIQQMVHGFSSIWQIIIGVVGPVSAVGLARWSSNTARTTSQAASVQAAVLDPHTAMSLQAKASILDATANLNEVKKDSPILVTDPELAAIVPASNVKSAT